MGPTTAALAGLALAVAACGGSSGGSAGGSGSTGQVTRTAPPLASDPPGATPAAVPAAFRFSAPALDGGRVVGADYADTGVALWFWAPW
jgi:hypothetical protein